MIDQTELDNLLLNHRDCSVSACELAWTPRDCEECSDYLLEAWERMTTGGLKVPCLPGYPYAHAVDVPVRAGHTGFTRHFVASGHVQYINDTY